MTRRILILADDFTGGNAVSARFSQAGYRAVTLNWEHLVGLDAVPSRFEVVVVCTDSRHAAHDIAADRVARILGDEGKPGFVGIRIDSTLRGAIGVMTRTALEVMRGRAKRGVIAVCVPAHPSAGRHTVNGRQLLEGVPLEDTELARDPLNPAATSDVMSVITAAGLRGGLIDLDAVKGPRDDLRRSFAALSESCDVIAIDATSEDHLLAIAEAVADLCRDLDVLAVDPGPFSVALADALGLHSERRERAVAPILGVIGSASELTAAQMNRLVARPEIGSVVAQFDPSGLRIDAAAAAEELGRAFEAAPSGGHVVLSIARDRGGADALSVEDMNRLVVDLAGVASKAMLQHPVGAVFCTGGDLTSALLSALGASGIEVEHEVLPLAVAGVVQGGRWDGLPIVTKGGMVGGDDAILLSFENLERRRNRIVEDDRPSAGLKTT